MCRDASQQVKTSRAVAADRIREPAHQLAGDATAAGFAFLGGQEEVGEAAVDGEVFAKDLIRMLIEWQLGEGVKERGGHRAHQQCVDNPSDVRPARTVGVGNRVGRGRHRRAVQTACAARYFAMARS